MTKKVQEPIQLNATHRQNFFFILFYGFVGPAGLLPIIILIMLFSPKYSPQELTELQKVPFIFQGGTDYGGSNIYATTLLILLFLGGTATLFLTLGLHNYPSTYLLKSVHYSFSLLKYHFFTFLLVGGFFAYEAPFSYFDCEIFSVFLIAFIAYTISVVFIVWLHKRRFPLPIKIVLAPLIIILWILLSIDGTTFKAGQILQAGELPHQRFRSIAHALVTVPQCICPRKS